MPIVYPMGGTGGGGGSGTVTNVSSPDTSIVVTNPTTTPSLQVATLDVLAANRPPAANWSNNAKKITGLANGSAATDAAAFGQIPAVPVASVFGRTGAVVAVDADYSGVVATHLTGATAASRYVGGTASGAPASGTFAVGDFVVSQDGRVWVCIVAGTPGSWTASGLGARAYNNANISIANGSTTVLALNSTVYDNDGMHSNAVNNSRLTIQHAGIYTVTASVYFAGGGGTVRALFLLFNGTTIIATTEGPPLAGGFSTGFSAAVSEQFAVGDYVECEVYQDSGGALDMTSTARYSPYLSATSH